MFWLKHILQPTTYRDLERAYTVGNPAELVSDPEKHTYEQYRMYRERGNLNLDEDKALVDKQLAKEIGKAYKRIRGSL